MRCPRHQKTSPQTLALPGFVVSGLSKMRGLMGSIVSFERVQMGLYRRSPLLVPQPASFEASHSKPGRAQYRTSSSRVEQPINRGPTGALHLNAFKCEPCASTQPPGTIVAHPTRVHPPTPFDRELSGLLHVHTLRGLSRQRCGPTWCRGMERASWLRIWRLMLDSPGAWLLQIAPTQVANTREFALASEPSFIELPIEVQGTSSTLRVLTCSYFEPHSDGAMRPRRLNPIRFRKAPSVDHERHEATGFLAHASLYTTTDFDTPSDNVETVLQLALQRDRKATEAPGREARLARDTDWLRLPDLLRSRLSAMDLQRQITPIYCRRSEARRLRPDYARSSGVTCMRSERKVEGLDNTAGPNSGTTLPAAVELRQCPRAPPGTPI